MPSADTRRHPSALAHPLKNPKTDVGAKTPGGPPANVGVGIGRGIVQIQREPSGIGAIVPIATPDEAGALLMLTFPPLHPASSHHQNEATRRDERARDSSGHGLD